MDILDLIIIGLASWRIASLLVQEDGPGLVFEKLRDATGANRAGEIEGFWPSIFSCLYCMSVWTTIAAFFIYLIFPPIVMLVAAMSIALIVNYFAKP